MNLFTTQGREAERMSEYRIKLSAARIRTLIAHEPQSPTALLAMLPSPDSDIREAIFRLLGNREAELDSRFRLVPISPDLPTTERQS